MPRPIGKTHRISDMNPRSDRELAVRKFGADLQLLRAAAGNPSFRALAARAHYSRTTLAQAVSGRALPSLEVTLAVVRACGGDVAGWERRWRETHAQLNTPAAAVAPAWPAEALSDGADPEQAGCAPSATTVHARKIAIAETRHVIGQVELRHSAPHRAAWGRFEGFSGLGHLATHRHSVEVDVRIQRVEDGRTCTFRATYAHDYHWCDLLLCAGETFIASADVVFDGVPVAHGETDALRLP